MKTPAFIFTPSSFQALEHKRSGSLMSFALFSVSHRPFSTILNHSEQGKHLIVLRQVKHDIRDRRLMRVTIINPKNCFACVESALVVINKDDSFQSGQDDRDPMKGGFVIIIGVTYTVILTAVLEFHFR